MHLASSIRRDLFIHDQYLNPLIYYQKLFILHAINVMTAPAVAPAAPKHVTVPSVGSASFVFAMTRGELPVALRIQPSYVYLAFW